MLIFSTIRFIKEYYTNIRTFLLTLCNWGLHWFVAHWVSAGNWGLGLNESGDTVIFMGCHLLWKSLISPLYFVSSKRKRGPSPRRGVPGYEWRHILWIQVSIILGALFYHDTAIHMQWCMNSVFSYCVRIPYFLSNFFCILPSTIKTIQKAWGSCGASRFFSSRHLMVWVCVTCRDVINSTRIPLLFTHQCSWCGSDPSCNAGSSDAVLCWCSG